MITNSTAQEAVQIIESNQRVYIHSVAGAPQSLIDALTERHKELSNVEICHLHIEAETPYCLEEYANSFHTNSLFIGSNVRKATQKGSNASYTPVFLSEVPYLFRNNILPIDVAMVQVSPPDAHGYCSLGISIEASKAAVDSASYVIAEINKQMPRTHGDGMVHISKFHRTVYIDREIAEHGPGEIGPIAQEIGNNVAQLVDDGACLQMGIGAIPNAVLNSLQNHKNLGIHTEMFSDGVIDLVERGVITGANKKVHPGKIITGFVMGSKKLYDFVDDNPLVNFLDIAYVNDVSTIRKNPKATSINSAIEVDLSGQVCADSIGSKLYSGVGGQMDFMRGASLSEGGKPIIALPSVTKNGESRIAPHLKLGAGVVTTRAHVHWVVTEYGAVNLYGKSIKQRAQELISIAHPMHRENLMREAYDVYRLKYK